MNNRQEIKSFLVVFEDENENEYQSSLIDKESSLYLLKESIELKYNKSIIDVYYYDLESEKCFIDEDNYSLMLEEKETNLLVPYSILHVITRNIN